MKLDDYKVKISADELYEYQVKRSWKERLFSLTPWVSTKQESTFINICSDGEIITSKNTLIMNERTWQHIRNNITDINSNFCPTGNIKND